ncbi:MAG: glutamate synthase-related protein [Chloroflexi bacterium]|nr:glutamate synthase-related protein [Chloroflexota bacterium]
MTSQASPTINDPFADLHPIDREHRDACALICSVRKGGQATHGNVKRTIEALTRMGHRTGYINGEGDGVGVLTDIPRQLWTKWLAEAGLRSSLATDRNFWVAHVMIPAHDRTRAQNVVDQICRQISEAGLHILIDRAGKVNRQILGPNAEKNEPVFWQIAGINGQVPSEALDRTLFELQVQLERELEVHFPSFSAHSVVYKVQGTIEILRRYYPELRDPDYASAITMGHARYSTNTNPIFERAQPFNLIGHNGEFNTISRFRLESEMLDIPMIDSGSDSQDVDRTIYALCMRYGLDLVEAMEHIFPPFEHDLIQNAPEIHDMYTELRQSFGPFAQGPAAVVARLGNQTVFSVDALGLRPLWYGETEKEYFITSERGVYALDTMSVSPKPMAPGEKIAMTVNTGQPIEVMDYPAIQQYVYSKYRDRKPYSPASAGIWLADAAPDASAPNPGYPMRPGANGGQQLQTQSSPVALLEHAPEPLKTATKLPWSDSPVKVNAAVMAGFGWERYHVEIVSALAQNAKEQMGSLGWDGPLAALSNTRANLADFFKETIAVVTNPSIDREREQAQFSSQVLIGCRPEIAAGREEDATLIRLQIPLLLDAIPEFDDLEIVRDLATKHGTMLLQDLASIFDDKAAFFSMGCPMDTTIDQAVESLQKRAVEAVTNGAQCVILDDSTIATGEELYIDPLLAVAAVDKALRQSDTTPNLRRRTGIVVRSGALRDLHDLAICLSLGANAILPYAMYAVGLGTAPRGSRKPLDAEHVGTALGNTLTAMRAGLQKITSTIGCHELRGYGHSFSSIGLSRNIANILGTPNYFGSTGRGLTWTSVYEDAQERAGEFRGEVRARLKNPERFYPKMWKKAEAVAHGELQFDDYTETLLRLEDSMPVSLRHILGLKECDAPIQPEEVDISVKGYDMPVLISAMSFGSQGELAYRCYAEAAHLLNIICMNGEGGEIHDLLGRHPRNRGQQVASGRFGVNIAFLNAADYIEIKIGQGAKPGEGGHLPGYKVTEQIAAVRSTTPGVGLISPSNNHDLYSIEDLAQLIDELKTANPHAKVSVKLPVVPGIGIIAVGVAKAGADIITITGYTGGTGAARAHALRHVGLPAEIGVWLAHRHLIESGLRDDVEIWVDGGMKSGRDVIKMVCLGANRVGFATLAMVALGCTICRGCQDGTCHVGITTHVKTKEEAEKRSFKAFRPFEERGSPHSIVHMFDALAEDIRKWLAKMGISNLQEIVGRADLLYQRSHHDRIDLSHLLKPVPRGQKTPAQPGGRRVTRPRNTVSKQITDIVTEYVGRGEYELTYDDEQVMAMDRALGTHLSGAIKRKDVPQTDRINAINLSFSNSAIPGNGLAAFIDDPVNVLVEGGAQDGVGKCALGSKVAILKGLNHNGRRLDGSVGKSFAYGAQGGLFMVQGDADTRACIRMSGADVVFGGEIDQPLNDSLGGLGARANLKGYAFEYMTSGRAVVLGDPGPWMCAGMTGGVVYQRVQPKMGLTVDAIRNRIASGSVVEIQPLDEDGQDDVRELLNAYIRTLEDNHQSEAAEPLYGLLRRPGDHFVKIGPPVAHKIVNES